MGRIITRVRIKNLLEEQAIISCDALVDTGAAYLVLPKAWKDRLGKIHIVVKKTDLK
jgi:predicted aspartyl protease